jgi:hypothetical protein
MRDFTNETNYETGKIFFIYKCRCVFETIQLIGFRDQKTVLE